MGPYNSGCAKLEVRMMNRAVGGPLAMISGASTKPGARSALGQRRSTTPTGIRSFRRILSSAAAFQLILAAVAASDGTRASVRAMLFSGMNVPASTSMLGRAFGIDPATGEATLREFGIARISAGRELDWSTVTL